MGGRVEVLRYVSPSLGVVDGWVCAGGGRTRAITREGEHKARQKQNLMQKRDGNKLDMVDEWNFAVDVDESEGVAEGTLEWASTAGQQGTSTCSTVESGCISRGVGGADRARRSWE